MATSSKRNREFTANTDRSVNAQKMAILEQNPIESATLKETILQELKSLADEVQTDLSSAIVKVWEMGEKIVRNENILGSQEEIAHSIGWKQQRVSEAIRIYKLFPKGVPDELKNKSLKKFVHGALPTHNREDSKSQGGNPSESEWQKFIFIRQVLEEPVDVLISVKSLSVLSESDFEVDVRPISGNG